MVAYVGISDMANRKNSDILNYSSIFLLHVLYGCGCLQTTYHWVYLCWATLSSMQNKHVHILIFIFLYTILFLCVHDVCVCVCVCQILITNTFKWLNFDLKITLNGCLNNRCQNLSIPINSFLWLLLFLIQTWNLYALVLVTG